jgi:DNA polymerase-3 subunit gamma/tau
MTYRSDFLKNFGLFASINKVNVPSLSWRMNMAHREATLTPYVVLARKWRSAQFSDLVGQSHVVRTLVNALKQSRLHQAYLFTGSRGIGKTSIARIFAKTLRCPEAKLVQLPDGTETFSSCDQCSNCREIAAGTSVDVIEIDGASNNGVDAVREIRDNAKFLPSSGTRKIYIIDEVHMLTTAAFNALLKTLEEPPPHVMFIFATTEPHKIPATVLSRVQRFDFRKASAAQIQSHLEKILKAEGVAWETGALPLVARAAEGSMRDSLSLLDQVIAFAGAKVTVAAVRESVGLVTSQTVLTILDGIFNRDPVRALDCVQRAFNEGHDLRVLNRSILEFLHATLLAKIESPHLHSAELTDEEWTEIRRIAGSRSLEEIDLFFQAFHHGYETLARSPQPKLALDVLIIKCASAEALATIESVSSAAATPSGGSIAAAKPAPLRTAPPAPEAKPAPEPARKAEAPAPTPAATSAARPRTWEAFIESVRAARPLLAALLENTACAEIFPAPAVG